MAPGGDLPNGLLVPGLIVRDLRPEPKNGPQMVLTRRCNFHRRISSDLCIRRMHSWNTFEFLRRRDKVKVGRSDTLPTAGGGADLFEAKS